MSRQVFCYLTISPKKFPPMNFSKVYLPGRRLAPSTLLSISVLMKSRQPPRPGSPNAPNSGSTITHCLLTNQRRARGHVTTRGPITAHLAPDQRTKLSEDSK